MARKKTTRASDDAAHKATSTGPLTVASVMEEQNTRCGPGTVFRGTGLQKDPPRLPTGIFAVDYVIGGGLPIYGSTGFWGGEEAGKSSMALNAARVAGAICWRCFTILEYCKCSQSPLKMKTYIGDAEGTVDRDWASDIGIDPENYILGLADYGQQHVNIAESMLRADDCGLVIIDSLAALTPLEEIEGAMEDQFIGLQARIITRMVRVLKQRLIRERKRGHPCTALFINQMRTKIGILFGSPETQPGGHGLQHEYSLFLRCVKKALKKDGVDKKYVDASSNNDVAARHAFSVQKRKVLTLQRVGEFVRVLEDVDALGLKKGMIDDFSTVMTYARNLGVVKKEGASWEVMGKKSKKLDNIKEYWKRDWPAYMMVQKEIIKRAKLALVSGEE